jgi:tetratricopeptide (TPR) repeat protein
MAFFLIACTQLREVPRPVEETSGQGPVTPPDEALIIGSPCTREQAEQWRALADTDGRAALRAASCYVFLIRAGKDKASQLKDAKYGRKLADNTVKKFPQSGVARYLAAYLTALEAKYDPLNGLELVPHIEREALAAAQLNPEVDHGGPDRMLGELYLRAPGFPVSIGDSSKAVTHFRRALDQDPKYPGNRLGLTEALLAEEDLGAACKALSDFLVDTSNHDDIESDQGKALDLLKKLCALLD